MNLIFAPVFLLAFQIHTANEKEERDCFISPCELQGEFDGDKKQDRATLIHVGKKHGIRVKFGNGKTVMSMEPYEGVLFERWSRHKGKSQQGTSKELFPNLKSDSILIEYDGKGSALLCWNNSKFETYAQGDVKCSHQCALPSQMG